MITTGIALTQGNLGNRIKVKLSNGSIIYAVAQTNIIGGRVNVIQDDLTKQWYCLSASSPVSQLNRTQKIYKSRPIALEEEIKIQIAIVFSVEIDD